MATKILTCQTCGSNIEVNGESRIFKCSVCGNNYIEEQDIINNNYYNNNYIQNAVFQNNESENKLLQNGITQIKLKEYEDALKTFKKMTEEYPGNYKGWLGLYIIHRSNHLNGSNVDTIKNHVLDLVSGDAKVKIGNLEMASDAEIMSIESKISSYEKKIADLNAKHKMSKAEGDLLAAIIYAVIAVVATIILFKTKHEIIGCLVGFLGGMISYVCLRESMYIIEYIIDGKRNKKKQLNSLPKELENAEEELNLEKSKRPAQYYINILENE